MIKLRSKIKNCLVLSFVATAIFVLYRTLASDSVPTHESYGAAPLKPDGDSQGDAIRGGRRQGSGGGVRGHALEEVNDLMPMTQPREHLERMRQHEAQMMHNVQKMIQHRMRETAASNRTQNGSVVAQGNRVVEPPSLWLGLDRSASHRSHPATDDGPPVVLAGRLVHLDLKGAPPTVAYLALLFPFLSTLGATGLLVEYEDMFPYWGRLEDIHAYNAYTRAEIAEILKLAAHSRLEVVPLVQTFGHLEFLLKRGTFRGLREVPAYPQAICPSRNETLATLREMIDQVLELHPNAQYLHVGCDEVYNLGNCAKCQEAMERGQFGPDGLFLQHVTAITRHVVEHHGKRAIVWDDMFRQMPIELIRSSDVAKYAELLVWKYGDTVEVDLPPELWAKYAECFPDGLWIASAFKGADFPGSFAVPVRARLENHRAWASAVRRYSRQVKIKGIFLTGWQRYDHFAILCELLPAGLPSLAISLAFLEHGRYDEEVERRVQQLLQCARPVALDLDANGPDAQCAFPGSDIYKLSLQFYTLRRNLDEQFFESNYVRGWVSDYNVRTRFSSPALLEQAIFRYGDGARNLSVFQAAISDALGTTYDRYTVAEWLDSNVRPLLRRMDELMAAMKVLLVQSEWPRRPITVPLDDADVNGAVVAAVNRRVFRHATEP